ncbi:hypothetical protein HID58_044508 [Brassica napus]|uniref:Uncharacterized protein n=1 Tax=Brassica napus TaxID=3708 RepID=A0ABQ8BL72_BRANA|nr:hypothetical protein HID58_044508 [Brassica napus]
MVDSSKTESDSHTCHRECPLSDHFQTSPHTGSMFFVSGFDVTGCNHNFRLSGSQTLLWQSDSMTEPVNPIPEERFRSAITCAISVVHHLADIIGELTAVKSNYVTVKLSLFDSQSVAFHNKLKTLREADEIKQLEELKIVFVALIISLHFDVTKTSTVKFS